MGRVRISQNRDATPRISACRGIGGKRAVFGSVHLDHQRQRRGPRRRRQDARRRAPRSARGCRGPSAITVPSGAPQAGAVIGHQRAPSAISCSASADLPRRMPPADQHRAPASATRWACRTRCPSHPPRPSSCRRAPRAAGTMSDRQAHDEARAQRFRGDVGIRGADVLGPDDAVMRLDDLLRDRQPSPELLPKSLLGRCE